MQAKHPQSLSRRVVSIGRYLGMFDAKVKVEAVYGISEEPMSAEEWNAQFCKD